MGKTTNNTIRAHKKRLLFDMGQQRCTPPRAAISPFAKGPAVCTPYLRNILEGGADVVFQIGTAKYGVRDALGHLSDDKLREVAAHDQVRMFELKLSQGAKPGKGGILPGRKVSREEVGVIAHSCGVREPRQLRRFNARIVTENRHSVSLEELYAAQSAQNDNTRPS